MRACTYNGTNEGQKICTEGHIVSNEDDNITDVCTTTVYNYIVFLAGPPAVS